MTTTTGAIHSEWAEVNLLVSTLAKTSCTLKTSRSCFKVTSPPSPLPLSNPRKLDRDSVSSSHRVKVDSEESKLVSPSSPSAPSSSSTSLPSVPFRWMQKKNQEASSFNYEAEAQKTPPAPNPTPTVPQPILSRNRTTATRRITTTNLTEKTRLARQNIPLNYHCRHYYPSDTVQDGDGGEEKDEDEEKVETKALDVAFNSLKKENEETRKKEKRYQTQEKEWRTRLKKMTLWRKELRSESRQRYQAECARRHLERQMGAAQVRRELFESADRLRSQAEDRIQRLRDATMSSSSSSLWIRWDGDGATPTSKRGETIISPLEQLKDHLKIMEQWAVPGRGRDCSLPLHEEVKGDL